MWRTPACQTLSKIVDISGVTAQVLADLLKVLAILSDTTLKICSWLRKFKTILEIRKKKIFLVDQQTYQQDFTNHRKKTNRVVVFSRTLSPNILKHSEHQWDLPIIWKTDSLRHILNSSATMYENSGSHFFRITTGIQLRPGTFHKSRLVMTFLTNLEVRNIMQF